MNKKIFQTVFLSIIITMVLVLAVSITVFHATYEERIVRDLDAAASFLRESVEKDGSSLDSLTLPGYRITLISPEGEVLFDSDAKSAEMENHLSRPEVDAAMRHGSGNDKRESSTLMENLYYSALRLNDGRILRLSVPAGTALSFIVSLLLPMVFIIILMIAISIWFSYKAARRICRFNVELN